SSPPGGAGAPRPRCTRNAGITNHLPDRSADPGQARGNHPRGVEARRARIGGLAGPLTSRGVVLAMADLIAIGYPDEATAAAAADESRRLARDLIIEPDAIAVIERDKDGKYHVHTQHHLVGAGASWGMFWGLLFGLLFFVPVAGIAIGAGLGALMGKVSKSGI